MPHNADDLAIGTDRNFRQQVPGFPGTFLLRFCFHIFPFYSRVFTAKTKMTVPCGVLVEQNYNLESGPGIVLFLFIVIRSVPFVVLAQFTADGVPDPIQNRFVFRREDIEVFAMNVLIIPPVKF